MAECAETWPAAAANALNREWRAVVSTCQIASERTQLAMTARCPDARTNPSSVEYSGSVHTATSVPRDSIKAAARKRRIRSKAGEATTAGSGRQNALLGWPGRPAKGEFVFSR